MNGPVFLTWEQLWAKVPRLRAAGIEEVALQPTGGRFLLTLSLEEFRTRVETGHPVGPRLP